MTFPFKLDEAYVPFPKIPRLSRDMVVSEKIDGTNAQIEITQIFTIGDRPVIRVRAGSRNRWLTLENDNYGFCAWVNNNAEELLALGEGNHFGEWWGQGIERGYGLKEKRFSLFNSKRWAERYIYTQLGMHPVILNEGQQFAPDCCCVAPVLYRGAFDLSKVDVCIAHLRAFGSAAAPGFTAPEGVIVFHTAANALFKKTLDRDVEFKARVMKV
jgi:hypothetical protein